MASFNTATAEHSTTFVATPLHLDQSATGPFTGATSHFITTTPPTNLHRQTTAAAVTSNSSSSSYTFLQIKREPCQVSEVTTSNHCHQQQHQQQHHHHQQQQHHHHQNVCSATSSTSISATTGTTSKTVSASTLTTLVKIEPPSPKVSDMLDKSSTLTLGGGGGSGSNTNNSVPIGIAVARKRPQESTATLGNCNSTAATIPLSQAINKDLNCFGFRVADFSGVGAGCGNFFFTGNGDLMTTGSTGAASAEEFALSAAGVQNVNRAPSTIWQYPSAALPFESVISMSPATVGLQYSREASRAAGQVVLLPAATAAALGISNIPPLCYTPTDPFQQAAALVWPSAATAAAYIPQGAPTPGTATLQTPPNFIFPTMNTAAAAAAHNAASLQLFGSSYLRNATEFMAAANKTTTTTHQNHLIATANGSATAAIAPTTTTLTLPANTPLNAAALSFEATRDKTTMTTTTTTNLLELQSNAAAAAQALNLIRLPTPPTSATICGGGGGGAGGHVENSTNTNTHHMTPTQILFQTSAAATNSPTPTLLNLSATGPNSAAATSAAILPRAHNFGATLTQNVGPPTPAGDEPPSTTTTPLPLNFKTTMPTSNATDSCDENSSNVAAATCITTQQPQMQDVNIQTETPVCSEDENSTCLHAQQTTLSHHATDGCLTPPTYHSHGESSEEAVEPLELTKNRHGEAYETNLHEQTSSQAMKSNTCHNAAAATANEATSLSEPPNSQADENEQPLAESAAAITTSNEHVYAAAAAATTTNDFAGLELLSNISTSTLASKPTTAAAILRVKQEPPDSMEEMHQQQQQQHYQQQQQTIFMPTIAAKLEHPTTTTCNNGAYQAATQHEEALNQNHMQSNSNENVASNSIMPTLVEAEPMPSGLNLLCAVLDREEEGVEGSSLFAATAANPSSQRATPTALSHYNNFYQQSQLKTPPPLAQPQQSYTTHFPNDLSATICEPPAIAASPHLAMHIKRKKRKHSKSSKSSTPTMSISSPCSVLLSNASGQQSPPLPSSIQCNSSSKSSKRSSKKSKKKYSKEKRRQQRAAAAAAAAAELDFNDEQLKLELQKAFINGGGGGGGGSAAVIGNAASKWPSAHEIFNIMETSMRQKLAKITRQYRKKKRKLEEISKTQREKKKSTKLLTQQLQQQMQLQQQALQPPPTAATTLVTTSALVGNNPLAAATNSSPLVDYKFNTKFSTNAAAATGPQISAATTYLQPSSFPLRFPPQATSTADEDSDRNSQQQQQQQQQHKHRTHNKQRHQQNIFKPVRLEPSALSAAVVANGNNNNNNNIGNNTNSNSNSCCIISNNSNSNTAANKDNFSSINAALRLAQQQQHQQQQQNLASSTNVKERKLSGGKLKTKRRSSESNTKPTPNIESNGMADAATAGVSPPKRLRNQFDLQLTLTNEHLYRKETRVLTDMGGLFYAGIMKPLQPPDIYAITLDGERGNKPHIMSREEIFKDTILEVAPKSIDCVPVGTRLCAYWSQQYRCLYPGRAIESESSEGDEEETAKKDFVSVEFDDGDSGRIRLQNIRLLMSDYPIVEYNDNPLYSLGKQKKTAIKSGSGSGSASGIIGVPDTSATLHDTSLGLSALMLGGEDGDEMYARRTEKKRLKKNPKKKSQPSLMKKAAAILSSNCNNNNASNDALTAAADDGNDHSRKHHKHKKHKKHKKHHRKTSSLQTIEYSTSATTNGFKMTANNCGKVDGYKSTTLNLNNNGFGISDDFDDDDGGVDDESSTENAQLSAVAHKPIKIEEAAAAAVGVKVKTERIEDLIEEESASNMMSENSDEAKCDDDDDEVEHNNSKGSKIAAFLPERQLWGWQGMAYRRAGVKGRARKQFYKTIKRGKELITVGDCAVFLSTGRPDRPYIGRIESMWETASSNKVVRVRWFYHPEETTGCPTLKYPGGLFESPHEDENDVQTISHRCEVLPFERYHEKFGDDAKKYQSIYDNNDTYYLAGYYNPRALVLNLQDDIPTAANTTTMTTTTASATNSNGSLIITKNKTLKPAIVGNGPAENTSTGTSIP